MDDPGAPVTMATGPQGPAGPDRPSAGAKWWSAKPDPLLQPIGARRAYAEVLLVYAAFFLAAIVAAGLLLADRYHDPARHASWAIYLTNAVDVLGQIGLAVAVVLLLAARRGVSPAALGFRVPRQADGRLAVSQTVRIYAWCFLAIIVGSIVNAVLQTGQLPEHHTSAPELIFSFVDSLQAGVIEELVVLAFVVVSLRQAGRPWWEVTVVALALRGAYHIYYGPGVAGILIWAALFLWLYLRFRQLVPLMVSHALWDIVAFFSQATVVVAYVGELVVAALWIAAVILWLVARGQRPAQPALYGPGGWAWQPSAGQPGAGPAGQAGALPAGQAGTFPAGQAGAVPGGQPAAVSVGQPGAGPAGWPGAVRPGPYPPPGWHPDPAGHNRWRWWDGYRWTEHVSPHS